MQKSWIQSLGWEDLLEEGMAAHSSILAWRILWTEESGRLQFMGPQRVRLDWITISVGGFPGELVVKNPLANAGNVRDMASIPGSGRSPGGRHGNPLQYSCLEHPIDRGAWRATLHRVAKSQTRLKQLSMHAHTPLSELLFNSMVTAPYFSIQFYLKMYRCQSWTIKKAECWRIDAFKLWWCQRLLRVTWTARRSNQSILKEINSKYSLEGLMLTLHTLATWCEQLTHWKRLWFWEILKAGERGNRGWDGWMASLTPWTWVWANSGRWWKTGKLGVWQSMGWLEDNNKDKYHVMKYGLIMLFIISKEYSLAKID